MKALLRVIILFALTISAMLPAGCVSDDVPEDRLLVGVGDPLPDFEVTMCDGSRVSPSRLLGSEALIVFFNTGCSDCRRELPRLQAYAYARPDLRVVCIAREESAEDIAAYWEEHALTLPYSPQPDRRVYSLFATAGIPRLILVSPEGRIAALATELSKVE